MSNVKYVKVPADALATLVNHVQNCPTGGRSFNEVSILLRNLQNATIPEGMEMVRTHTPKPDSSIRKRRDKGKSDDDTR